MNGPQRSGRHSENNEWTTPLWLFDLLHEKCDFTLDGAATPENALLPRFGLEALQSGDRMWINPPYGRDLAWWIHQGSMTGIKNSCMMLVPVRTSVEWWQEAMRRCTQVVFIRGRLQFSGHSVNAPFDSAIFSFGVLPKIERICALRGSECVAWR